MLFFKTHGGKSSKLPYYFSNSDGIRNEFMLFSWAKWIRIPEAIHLTIIVKSAASQHCKVSHP